jgi:eukaryotic-like serine/threonine-protein kinase
MDDTARFARLQSLFHDAMDRPEAERRTFVGDACGDDDVLRAEVLAMLEESAREDSLLDRDIGEIAQQLLCDAFPLIASGTVDRYRLEEYLGKGGMGVVYRAVDTELGRPVAIKLSIGASLSPASREQFAREQRVLAQLDHRFIGRLYDADILPDGTPWFAMEYVDGVFITDYCQERSIDDCLRLFRDVCEAVQHAHGELVIHCDLKPSNILVKPDGTVKLLDFGISKQLLDAPLTPATTRSGAMTLDYAAPEQIRGNVSVRTDIYSLGVILYELLARQRPFDLADLTPGEMEQVIREKEPERPSVVAARNATPLRPNRARSWADLDVLCLTAMHKDEARRYRNVGQLIGDIDRYLSTEPLKAQPDTVGYRVGKFVSRNRRGLSIAAVIVAMVMSMATVFAVRLANARDEALAAAARTARIQRFTLNLFTGGDAEAPSAELKVTTLVERGIQEARMLTGEPEIQAEVYHTLGTISQNLGNLGQADTLVTTALDQRRKLFGREHAQTAESLIALGLVRMDQARLAEAEDLVRKGLEIRQRLRPFDVEAVADAMTSLGRVLDQRGQYDKAIAILEEAVKIQPVTPGLPTVQLAESLTELANAHHYAGHFERADELNTRILAIDRQRFSDQHINVANDLINLGASQAERGHYKEAEQYYRQALPITESWYPKDHPEIASNLRMLATTLVSQKRLDEAEALLLRAVEIDERSLPPNHPRLGLGLHALGNVNFQRGDYDEAQVRFQRAADIFRAAYGDDHQRTITAVASLASVAIRRNDFVRAETLLRDVLARLERVTPGHVNIGINHVKLGRALMGQLRYRDAIAESLAGYQILVKQANPSITYLHDARTDLVTAYEALNEPERAAPYRQELAAAEKK